jgi:hypothetical protein
MKKTILTLCILVQCVFSHAQVFFSENFASGLPPGWTNIDNSGNNITWRVTTTGALNSNSYVDTVLSPAGTTAANGYLIFDSDSAGQGMIEDAMLTTTAISCAGHTSVHLSFNEYFAQYLASTGTVSVSNNNITWTDVHFAHTGLGLNQGTLNPDAIDLDISSIAAGQGTVYIRFHYYGEWDYWWFIDDVELFEPLATDLAVTSIEKLNSEYTLIPFPQATALTMSAEVKNNGGSGTAGGSALFEVVNVDSAQTVFSETISLSPLVPGASQVVMPTSLFTPLSAGSYQSKLTVSIAGDGNSANDMLESAPIHLSDSVYARDDDNFAGVQGIGVGPGEDAITGQNFYVNNTDLLTSITFFMGDNFGAAANGTPVYFTVHPQVNNATGPDGNTVLAVSDTIYFTPGMIPAGGAYYTVPVQGGAVQLSPGLYYIGIHETDSILTIGYSNSIYSSGAVWVHWNSIPSPPAVNGWARAEDFTLTLSYMIRANFGNGPLSIHEPAKAAALIIYPNPSKGAINLQLKNRSIRESYHVKLFNLSGQVVYQGLWMEGDTYRIDPRNLSPGMYTVLLFSGSESIAKIITIAE